MSIANLPTAYLTIAEVAAAMRLSRMTVYRMVRAGTLAADRFGKSYRVPESAVEEYIRQAGTPATGDTRDTGVPGQTRAREVRRMAGQGPPELRSGMVPLTNLAAFALVSALLIAVPGPSVLFVIGRSLALGRRGGLLSVAGNAVGELLQIAVVALGLGVVLAQSVLLFTVVKFAGAVYLIYLGIQAVRQRKGRSAARDVSRSASTMRILREGFIVGATNPKSVVFFVAVLPQFVDHTAGAIPLQLAVLGATFLVIALISDSAWALAAGTARQWFARSPRRISAVSATGGAMMIALGGTLALTGTKN